MEAELDHPRQQARPPGGTGHRRTTLSEELDEVIEAGSRWLSIDVRATASPRLG